MINVRWTKLVTERMNNKVYHTYFSFCGQYMITRIITNKVKGKWQLSKCKLIRGI